MRKFFSILLVVVLYSASVQFSIAQNQNSAGPILASSEAVEEEPLPEPTPYVPQPTPPEEEPPTYFSTQIKGKITKVYLKGEKGTRPEWVDKAVRRSFEHLKTDKGKEANVDDPESELHLIRANEDDGQKTHIRFEQVSDGVPVFGEQIITHLTNEDGFEVTGKLNNDAKSVKKNPKISPDDAILAAKASLGYAGNYTKAESTLVILPHKLKKSDDAKGATLCYLVELLIEDGTDATARHFYFIEAQKGDVVWHYDNLQKAEGYGLYTPGKVAFPTLEWGGGIRPNGGFSMRDFI